MFAIIVKAIEAVHVRSFDKPPRPVDVPIADRPTPPLPFLFVTSRIRCQHVLPHIVCRILVVGVGGLTEVADGNGENTFEARARI